MSPWGNIPPATSFPMAQPCEQVSMLRERLSSKDSCYCAVCRQIIQVPGSPSLTLLGIIADTRHHTAFPCPSQVRSRHHLSLRSLEKKKGHVTCFSLLDSDLHPQLCHIYGLYCLSLILSVFTGSRCCCVPEST